MLRTAAKFLEKQRNKPGKVVLWPIWVVLAVLFLGAFYECRQFPWNGSPFTWVPANAYYNEAVIHSSRQERDQAITKVLKAIQTYKGDARFYQLLADEKRKSGEYDDALDALTTAMKLKPNDELIWLDAADLLFSEHKVDQAYECLQNAKKLSPGNADVVAMDAMLLAAQGKPTEAAIEFAKIQKLPKDNARAWYYSGIYYSIVKKKQEAEASYRQAFGIEPRCAKYAATLGTLLMKKGTEAAPDAEVLLNRATQLEPDNALYWRTLADARIMQKKYPAAEAAYKEACSKNPARPDYWLLLGQSQFIQGHWETAAPSFKRVTELQPYLADAWQMLILALAKQNKLDEAKQAVSGFLAVNAGNSNVCQAWIFMGELLGQEGNVEDSRSAFKKALSLSPTKNQAEYSNQWLTKLSSSPLKSAKGIKDRDSLKEANK